MQFPFPAAAVTLWHQKQCLFPTFPELHKSDWPESPEQPVRHC